MFFMKKKCWSEHAPEMSGDLWERFPTYQGSSEPFWPKIIQNIIIRTTLINFHSPPSPAPQFEAPPILKPKTKKWFTILGDHTASGRTPHWTCCWPSSDFSRWAISETLIHSSSESSVVLRSRPLAFIRGLCFLLWFCLCIYLFYFVLPLVFPQLDTASSIKLVNVLSPRPCRTISA